MCRGLGSVERILLGIIQDVVKPARIDGGKLIMAARIVDICKAVYGPDYTISQKASLTRAVKSLESKKQISTFYVNAPTTRGVRLTLCVKY